MSNLQAAVRALASPALTPDELCAQLNRILLSNVVEGKFVTFFYCLLDMGARRLTYSNSGHNPPVLLRRDGSRRLLRKGGMVLGAFPDRQYAGEEILLAPGERVVLYTDGIVEASAEDGEEFGQERLLDFLDEHRDIDPAGTLQRVLDTVVRHGRGSLNDDATLLILDLG